MIKFELNRTECEKSKISSFLYCFKLKEEVKITNFYLREVSIKSIMYNTLEDSIIFIGNQSVYKLKDFNIKKIDMDYLKMQIKIGMKIANMCADLEIEK